MNNVITFRRTVEANVNYWIKLRKIVVLYGPRQVGKTTLLKSVLQTEQNSLYLNCDDPAVRSLLENRSATELGSLVGSYNLVGIDEGQRVKNIGITLKLLADTYPDVRVIATGSSSFELANEINEPLTGRKVEILLYPISAQELSQHLQPFELKSTLSKRLVFGMYPDIIRQSDADAQVLLRELAGSYLFKDILNWNKIRKPDVVEKLLRALALQIGNEVSYAELGSLVGIDKNTVESYIHILEQAFIIFRLSPFNTNRRNEIKRLRKVYFWDIGIRNAVIANFNSLDFRADVGALWENFIVSERIKALHNSQLGGTWYFWRTHDGQEMDWLEERAGLMTGAEIKWSSAKRWKVPPAFAKAFPDVHTALITPDNFAGFLNANRSDPIRLQSETP